MGNIKAYYETSSDRHNEIIEALDRTFSLKPTYVEDYISMRGDEDSGIETVRLSLEEDVIKIMVVLENDILLDKFNEILGAPTKIKGRR